MKVVIDLKKITILALHLNYGGIERFITNLANSLSDEYEIEIISTYKLLDKPFFQLNNNIKVKYLITDLKPNKQLVKKYLKSFHFIKLFKEIIISLKILHYKKKRMIRAIKDCSSDIIISTRDIHNKWVGKYAKKNIIKIGSEHNDINSTKYIRDIARTAKNLDYFVVVSKKMIADYQKYLNIPVIHIPNSIASMPKCVSNLDSNSIVSAGRLESVKGYEDLIDVMQMVVSKNKNIILNIAGDGSQYELLQEKIRRLKLTNNIKLLGYKDSDELDKLYNESFLYIMTSFSESFGLVLLEAMSHKLPCLAFDSANGACEIIDNNKDGYLIEKRNKEEMAEKILHLYKHREENKEMGNMALEKAEKYTADKIKQKWIDVFER